MIKCVIILYKKVLPEFNRTMKPHDRHPHHHSFCPKEKYLGKRKECWLLLLRAKWVCSQIKLLWYIIGTIRNITFQAKNSLLMLEWFVLQCTWYIYLTYIHAFNGFSSKCQVTKLAGVIDITYFTIMVFYEFLIRDWKLSPLPLLFVDILLISLHFLWVFFTKSPPNHHHKYPRSYRSFHIIPYLTSISSL